MTTKGEYRVGTTFNPSADSMVDKIKRLGADLLDLIETIPVDDISERGRLKAIAQTEIEGALHWAVKAATKPAWEGDAPKAPAADPFRDAIAAAVAAERATTPAGMVLNLDNIHAWVKAKGFPYVSLAEVHDATLALETGRG